MEKTSAYDKSFLRVQLLLQTHKAMLEHTLALEARGFDSPQGVEDILAEDTLKTVNALMSRLEHE